MQIELAAEGWKPEWSELSDAQILASVGWKRGTPTDLVNAARRGQLEAFVSALATGWQSEIQDHAPCRALWTLPAIIASQREQELAVILSQAPSRAKYKRIPLKAGANRPLDPVETLALAAVHGALPELPPLMATTPRTVGLPPTPAMSEAPVSLVLSSHQ